MPIRCIRVGIAILVLLSLTVLGQKPISADDGGKPRILLLKTQLLETPGGYPALCKEHPTTKRSVLGPEMVAKLKAIAAEEQARVLEALGRPKDARPLWIVNALGISLTDMEVEKAKALEEVIYVYPGGAFPKLGEAAGKVKEVLRRHKKRRWSPRKKRIPWNIEGLNVPKVWKELGITGNGVVVAMFDAGINYRHEDIKRNVWTNPDEKPNNRRDDDKNGFVDDYYGWHMNQMKAEVLDKSGPTHGALTSSVVAGDGTGGTQTGVAPRAQLMSLVGFGGPWIAARCFEYAIEEGADVCSMSFSIPNLGHTRGLWRRMAEHASACGLVLISGAGNFGQQQQIPVQIRIPEGIPCVICIGGANPDLTVPAFVSLGPVEWSSVHFYEDYPMPKGLVKPDVVAFPGPGIALIKGLGKDGYLPEDNKRRGNSLSAPHAAGVVALMLEANPELTPWRVKAILESTAKDLEDKGKDPRSGAGLIDAFAAVKRAQEAK